MSLYKLQIGCLIIILYIAFTYWHECWRLKKKVQPPIFHVILVAGIVYYFFDIATGYTVNHLETVNPVLNKFFHAGFLLGIDLNIFLVFLYMLFVTGYLHRKEHKKVVFVWTPFILNAIVVIANIGTLEYRSGSETNYSMGVSAYTCFIMVAVYILMTLYIFVQRWNYIEKPKKASIGVFLAVLTLVSIYQMFVPESLISCLGITINILGIYINMENPARMELEQFHKEMVYGFANIIESRDGSTGQHVKRTTEYVGVIANGLAEKGYYKTVLTKDYVKNLLQAAPLHDIGKVATPDAILQKPGRLTPEEFDVIKLHAANGAKIIKESMRNLGDSQYINMAYNVALHHHEKWNGCGYPDGLSGEEIPLAARIMAVADVFDAVVEKRCYREAMSLDEGFHIIEEGIGTAFDPVIAQIFLEKKDKIIELRTHFQ